MKKKRVKILLMGAPLTQAEMIEGLSKRFPDVRLLEYDDSPIHFTSPGLRAKGIVVCSDCGQIASDNREKCPSCGNYLVAIVKEKYDAPINQAKEKVTELRKHIVSTYIKPKS